MSDYVNTVSVIGDQALTDSIIDGSVTEIVDDYTTSVFELARRTNLKKAVFLSATYVGDMSGCTALEELVLPKVESYRSFRDCASLKKIELPSLTGVLGDMWGCRALEYVDGGMASQIGEFAFYLCNQLKTLILRKTDTICTNPRNAVNSSVKVYVPSALIEEYKAATNWSAIAANILPLEEYTVDGTVTGEMDETKI